MEDDRCSSSRSASSSPGRRERSVLPGTVKIGTALLWVAAILTLYTGFDYLQSAWRHFGEDEAA